MDFTQENVVSVWLGAAVSEEAFNALLDPPDADADGAAPPRGFEREFGLESIDDDFMEASWSSEDSAVAELLDGVSYGASFAEAVVAIAGQSGIARANAFVLLFDVAYVLDPDLVSKNPTLQFLGAFPYDPDAGEELAYES
jgi:hypothetical protein